MSEKNLIPELRFQEFEGRWYEKQLSDLLTFKNGVNASKEDYGRGYKFINVLDIIKNDFITHDKILGSVNIDENTFEKNIVEYGDILFQRSSETREEVGQASVYLDKNRPATFGGFVIRGKKRVNYDPAFMNALFKTSRSRKEITSKSGGSTRYNVGQDTLSAVIIITTNFPEQQKIASFLTSVDRRIQLLQKKKAKLEEYKKGVMQKLFSREIQFRDEKGNEFPDWEEKRLGEVSNNIMYGMNASATSFDGNHKYVRITDISEITRKFNPKPITSPDGIIEEKFKLSKGDIVFARTGASVGKSYLYDENDGDLYFAGFLIKFSITKANPYFVFLQTLNYRYDKWVKLMSMRSGQPGINAEEFKTFKIHFPSLPEQQKIASFLSGLDQKIEQIGMQLEKMQVWKKGLLQKMFV